VATKDLPGDVGLVIDASTRSNFESAGATKGEILTQAMADSINLVAKERANSSLGASDSGFSVELKPTTPYTA
jgi:hypothetical protein